jgi:EAL domain-containing protein (putative c-di-GMP-specific phosphodiesterase class I)
VNPRRNEVALIARLAPNTLSFLQIPLTPSRAARLADVCARTGIDAQSLVLELLDDAIFSTSHAALPAPTGDRSSIREGHEG